MPSEKPDFLKIILPFTMSVMCIISYSVFNEHWFFSLSQNMLARICLHIRLSGFTVTQTLACIPVKPTKMGSSGLEPPTSRLSGARSNLLSYEPASGTVPPPYPHLLWLSNEVLSRSSALDYPWFAPMQSAFGSLRFLTSHSVPVRSRRSVFRFTSVMEMMGFEPMTPCLQGRCSPN